MAYLACLVSFIANDLSERTAAPTLGTKKQVDLAVTKMLKYSPVEDMSMGNKVKTLEKEVRELSRDELSTFRDWFVKFDADGWDRQIESDIEAGKLDELAAKALSQHKRGESRNL